jgi:voltage-gated potassium channel Kch
MRAIAALPFVRTLVPIWNDPDSRALLMIALGQVTVGTLVFSVIEDWSIIDAFYYCVVTSTTVGYGDFVPTTDAGRLLAVGYIITSVGLVVALLSRIAMGRVERRAALIEQRREDRAAPSREA